MAGNPRPERYLFYGMDYLERRGFNVRDNIRDYRPPTFFTWRALWIYRRFIKIIGAYGGALEWVLPHRRSCASANLLFVYSDRLMFPLINLRLLGLLPRRPTVYIAMGLPEKFEQFRKKSRLPHYIAEFGRLEKIISLSKMQAEILRNQYGLTNADFICDGVDTIYFTPSNTHEDVDVLSIGADPFRDFKTLLDAAARLPGVSFRIIASSLLAAHFPESSPNVEILVDLAMGEIRDQIARSRLLVLPVRENSYSGGTTVLLQALSMGKPVIANAVGANKDGYYFVDGVNCLMVPPEKPDALVLAISKLVENPDTRNDLGKEARRTSLEQLDIGLFHKKLSDIVQTASLKSSPCSQQ